MPYSRHFRLIGLSLLGNASKLDNRHGYLIHHSCLGSKIWTFWFHDYLKYQTAKRDCMCVLDDLESLFRSQPDRYTCAFAGIKIKM
jgi:hypothetical protein